MPLIGEAIRPEGPAFDPLEQFLVNVGIVGGRRGQGGIPKAGEEGPTSAEQHLEPVAEGIKELEAAGEEDVKGQEAVIAENRAAAQAESEEMKLDQRDVEGKFDAADLAADVGLDHVRRTVSETRTGVDLLPGEVRKEFDRQQVTLDAALEPGRAGIAGQRNEAVAGVMAGQANAMDAAVSSLHGATRQQIADIDAQVQQGTLSPSQAQVMKNQVRMGSAMQLSAAVGQTAHMFTQTEADVATSFGEMFGQFESQAVHAQGQFGAAAGSAFGNAQAASAQFNTELTGIDAQATAHRGTLLSQNVAARATFNYNKDTHNMAMMDYTADTYVSAYPMAMNNLTAVWDLASDYIKSEQHEKGIALMMQNMDETQKNNLFNMVWGGIQAILGF